MLVLDKAIFAILDADQQSQAAGSLGALGCLGVYADGDVPKGQQPPYVRFLEMAAPAQNAMGDGPTIYAARYTIFGVDAGNDKTRADAFAQRAKALLHKVALTLDPPFVHIQTLVDGHVDLPDRYEGETFEQMGRMFQITLRED